MNSRVAKAMCCALSVILLSSAMTELAYAPTNYEAFQRQRAWESSNERKEALEKFEQSEKYRQLQSEGDKLASRIETLPDDIVEKDRGTVKELRLDYDRWIDDIETSWASVAQEYPNADSESTNIFAASLGVNYSLVQKLEKAEKQLAILGSSKPSAKHETKSSTSKQKIEENRGAVPNGFASALADPSRSPIVSILLLVWCVFFLVQAIMAYGTAYRKTKAHGDSGVSLFGWLIAYNLAAIIPFLGIYLWSKSKK